MNATSDEKAIFLEALERESDAERNGFVDQACQGDAELRHRVMQLLKAHGQAKKFLGGDSPADETLTDEETPLGTLIGPYKLLEQLGEGGMGVVYRAEQRQPVARIVALKIIKPGMDSRQVIARFEAERQALAMMDHPNIARVLDAGTVGQSTKSEARSTKRIPSTKDQALNERKDATHPPVSDIPASNLGFVSDFGFRASDFSLGRPYFAMELVQGIPITKYCADKSLNLRQRLSLFVTICEAIQHAHQKGIIHRDLKPSNVLVGEIDGRAIVKVIDFGIAKAVHRRLTDQTVFTESGQLLGTIEYMSPEQARLDPLDVDTRSDVYSLGVLLYELLTGTTPFDKATLRQAGWDELRRIIQEQEPETVSQRLARTKSSRQTPCAVPTAPPATSTNHQHSLRHPSSFRLHPFQELDWIVAKSLEKNRNDRYESASGLARDVERYLRDEPVQACPPTPIYRFRKFANKHRAAFFTTLAIAASLLIGIILSTWQAMRAMQAESEATANRRDAEQRLADVESERQRAERNFEAALNAMDQMLAKLTANDLADYPRAHLVQRDALVSALKFMERITAEPKNTRADRERLALRWLALGTTAQTLRYNDVAQRAFESSLAMINRVANEAPQRQDYLESLKSITNATAWYYTGLGQNRQRAEELFKELASTDRALIGFEPDPQHREKLLSGDSLSLLGLARTEEDSAKALRLLDEVLEITSRNGNPLDRTRIAALCFKADRLRATAPDESVALRRQVIELDRQWQTAFSELNDLHRRNWFTDQLQYLGEQLSRQEPLDAERFLKESVAARRALALDHPTTYYHRRKLTIVLRSLARHLQSSAQGNAPTDAQKLADAAALWEEAIDSQRALVNSGPADDKDRTLLAELIEERDRSLPAGLKSATSLPQ